MKYEARLTVVKALHALGKALVDLQALFDTTPVNKRVQAVKAFDKALFTACVDAHDGNADTAIRQCRFHAFTLPYVDAVGHAFAVDGGAKRGQVTLLTCTDTTGKAFAVITALDGNAASTKCVDTFTGTLAFDRAKACYRAVREGMPYVVKAKGKFAVSDNGAHVNAALVTVAAYEGATGKAKRTFDVYRAHGTKGKGTAYRASEGKAQRQ